MNFGDFHAEAFVENFPSIFHAPQFPRESSSQPSQRRREYASEYVKRESCLLKAQKLFMMDNFITQSKLYLLSQRARTKEVQNSINEQIKITHEVYHILLRTTIMS